MEKEHQILTCIQQQDNATQRDIANHTGMGLGTVNILLKKMIKTGWIKIERLNGKSLRYMITPKGFKEKTKRTYNYIKHSYNHINTVTKTVEEIFQSAALKKADLIYLYGPHNEMYEIIKLVLQKNKHIQHKEVTDQSLSDITNKDIILVWSLEEEEMLPTSYNVLNILKNL